MQLVSMAFTAIHCNSGESRAQSGGSLLWGKSHG
jgi:hypothetical protein